MMNQYRFLCITFLIMNLVSQPLFSQENSNAIKVSYISADHVYLNAGQKAGLKMGHRLVIRDQNGVAAELEVVFAAQNSSSCKIIRSTRTILAGEMVIKISVDETQPAKAPEPVKMKKPEPKKQTALKTTKKKKTGLF